jgi:hypothetical protein
MTAKEKFSKHDRVQLSAKGREHFSALLPRVETGEVVGFGRKPNTVRIVLDGNKQTTVYNYRGCKAA